MTALEIAVLFATAERIQGQQVTNNATLLKQARELLDEAEPGVLAQSEDKGAVHRCDRYALAGLPGVEFCRKDGARIVAERIKALTIERDADVAEKTKAWAVEFDAARGLLQRKLDDLAERFKALETENAGLREQLAIVKTERKNVWVWMGDGTDNLATLVRGHPVVMAAHVLRGMLAKAEADAAETGRKLAREEIEKLRGFKAYVHQRLDEAGVPADPEPEANAKHGCRVEGRLNAVLGFYTGRT